MVDALDPYVHAGHLRVWSDLYIPVGGAWRREIDVALTQTRVAVLLVSAAFETSPFIRDVELPALLAAADAGQVVVVAVPVSASTASEGAGVGPLKDLADYQWVRSPRDPLDRLSKAQRTAEMVRIAKVVAGAYGPLDITGTNTAAAPRVPIVSAPTRGTLGALYDVPPLPPDLVQRPATFQQVKAQVLGREFVGLTGHVVSVGVQGLAGVGKTVLAQVIAHDDDVRRSFPDGIYWVTVGQRSDLWPLQTSLLRRLDPSATASTLVEVRALLKERLESRSVLLVLDDVWDVAQALAFDLLSPQSSVLITTREAAVIRALGAAEYALDVFTRDESLALLAQRSGTTELPPEAAVVAEAAGDLPLALAVVAAAVRDGRSWHEIRRQLEDTRIAYEDHPFRQAFQALETSVQWLLPTEAARYLELAVFPDDERVAEAVVQRYWAHTGGMDAASSSFLLERLHDKNLLFLSGSGNGRVLSFHDLQLQYLRLQADDPETLHTAFLAAYYPSGQTQTGALAWADLQATETYVWRHIADHLHEAGAATGLRELLLDATWIEAKLRATGLEDLLATYVPFSADPVVSLVADALRLAAHALISTPDQVRAQLYGRLKPSQSEDVQAVAARLAETRSPWLKPISPTLISPGGPLQSVLLGHHGRVLAVAITADGTRAVSGSDDHTLRVWDLMTGRTLCLLEPRPHERDASGPEYWAVTVTSDGTRAVSVDRKAVRVWDLASGRALHILEHPDTLSITGMAVTPDGTRAVSMGAFGNVVVWDLQTGLVQRTFEAYRRSFSGYDTLTVTPDGACVVSSFGDRSETPRLCVWDLASGEFLHTLNVADKVSLLALTPDGSRAISGSERTLHIWDLSEGRLLHILEGHSNTITAVAVTADGTRAVSASDDQTLRVWEVASGRLLHVLDGHSRGVGAVSTTPDGTRAVSGSTDGTLRVWDLTSGQTVRVLEGHTENVNAVGVTPDGTRVISASSDHSLRVWQLSDKQAPAIVTPPHTGPITSLTVTRDGTRALSTSSDTSVVMWDLSNGRVLRSFEVPPLPDYDRPSIGAVTITEDGTRALSAAWDGLRVWDLESGDVVHTLREHSQPLTAVAVTRDATLAVSASEDETLRVWELATGHCILTLDDMAYKVAVAPDGTRALAAGGNKGLRVWDLARGRMLLKAGDSDVFYSVAMTPDWTRAVSARWNTLYVWDLWSRHPVHTLEGHIWPIFAVAITQDGTRAVSGSQDKTVRVWDLVTGAAIHVLEGHTGEVKDVAMSADGRWSASIDETTLRLWDLERGSCFASFTGDSPLERCTTAGDRVVLAGTADGRLHILRLEGKYQALAR